MIDHARLTRAYFEPVAAIRGLQVVCVLAAKLENALHRSRHVLVQAVGELDDDDRAFAWRTQKTPHYSSTRFAANFAQHNVHVSKLAHLRPPAKLPRKNPAFLRVKRVSSAWDLAAADERCHAANRRVRVTKLGRFPAVCR